MRLAVPLLLVAATLLGCRTARPPVEPFEGVRLLGSRPGRVDVYFLGVGGHTSLEVFHNEALLARDRFRARFNTEGRELLLINSAANARTRAFPRATLSSLARAIEALGEVMDPEDVLVVYLASHGRVRVLELKDGRRRHPLRPGALRSWLTAAGIERRLMLISACYAGSFIEDLEDEDTVLYTAASSRRPSFGCKAGRRLTFFGKALLEEAWDDALPLDAIFDRAVDHIRAWETRDGLRSSEPQRSRGARMRALLDELEGER